MATIEIITGSLEGTLKKFETELMIGSADNVALQITDNGISRNHAKIGKDGADFQLTDLGSSNGTYVNFRRLNKEETTKLNDRDVIFCGRTVMKFFAEAAPARGGLLSADELRDLLRGTIPLKTLTEQKKELGELARTLVLKAERAEVMRRLGLHRMSQSDLKGLMDKARA